MSQAPSVVRDANPTQSSAGLTEHAPSERLAAALRVAVHHHADSLDGVRQAVGAYARALKASGEPPEAVLVSVKDFVRRAPAADARPFAPPDHRIGAEQRQRLALTAVVVQWAINAYYEDGTT